MENTFYEVKPFLCLIVGTWSMAHANGTFGVFSSVVLLGSGALILYLRHKSRSEV